MATSSTILQFDFTSKARITRKTFERLSSFSIMRSASGPSPLLEKTLSKINAFVKLLDSSILNAQISYQLATNARILCDPENRDWIKVGTAIEDLRELATKGSDLANEVAIGLKDVEQVIYKIAASTKDNLLVVEVPPDAVHSKTIKKHLKDVGTDLVANVKLFTQFSSAVEEIAEWWNYIKNDFISETPTLLPSSPDLGQDPGRRFSDWESLRENLKEYYNIVNPLHLEFPDPLSSSAAAWQPVTPDLGTSVKGRKKWIKDTRSMITKSKGLAKLFDLDKRNAKTKFSALGKGMRRCGCRGAEIAS